MAFTYRKGIRPNSSDLSGADNLTPDLDADYIVGGISPKFGPFKWVIARYDDPSFQVTVNRTDRCHVWIWMDTDEFYDIPVPNENSEYFISFNETQTIAMKAGNYVAYLQFDGPNNIQDVYYDESTMSLKSIYNLQIAPDSALSENTLFNNSSGKFDQYTSSIRYYDDIIIPVSISVKEPAIWITAISQENNKVYISGTTSMKANTSITLKLDPEQHPRQIDSTAFTWETTARGTPDAVRTFETALAFDWTELSIGRHHIDLQKTGDPDFPVTSYEFRRGDIYVTPTPTPKRVAVITGIDYSDIPTQTTAPTITVTTIPATPIAPAIVDLSESDNISTQHTTGPVSSTRWNVSPTQTRDPNIHVPIPIWIPVIAMIIFVLLRRRNA
jgi:hypothetical protein